MLFLRFISPNPIGSRVKIRWMSQACLNFLLVTPTSVISEKIKRTVKRRSLTIPLRVIQQITKALLLLAGGIHFNAFAADSQQTEGLTNYFIGTKSVPSPLETSSERVNGSYWKEVNGLPKELLETTHDVIQGILSSSETNGQIRFAAERLKEELDERVLSHRWEVSQIIDFIRERIAKKESTPFMRVVEIRVMGEFLKLTTLPDSEILDIVDLLGGHFSRGESNPYIKVAAIQVTGEILSKYALSADKVSQTLSPLLENVFDGNTFVAKAAGQVLVRLLSKGIVSDPTERREIALMTSVLLDDRSPEQSWEVQLKILNSFEIFLGQEILSDSEKLNIWRKVALLIFDQSWAINNKVFSMLKSLWISDFPHSGKVKILRTVERSFPNASYRGKRVVQVLRAAVRAGLPPDLDTIHKKWINSNVWDIRKDAVSYLYAFLRNSVLLSSTSMGKILFLIKKLVTDRDPRVREVAVQGLSEFLSRDGLFDLPERKKIMFMAMNRSFDPDQRVQRAVVGARKRFIKQGVLTEELAIEFVSTRNLSALDKMIIGLELDKQFSEINSFEEQQEERNETCQKAMTAVQN